MFQNSGVVLEPGKDEHLFTQKSAGVHGHASRLNNELLADIIIRPH